MKNYAVWIGMLVLITGTGNSTAADLNVGFSSSFIIADVPNATVVQDGGAGFGNLAELQLRYDINRDSLGTIIGNSQIFQNPFSGFAIWGQEDGVETDAYTPLQGGSITVNYFDQGNVLASGFGNVVGDDHTFNIAGSAVGSASEFETYTLSLPPDFRLTLRNHPSAPTMPQTLGQVVLDLKAFSDFDPSNVDFFVGFFAALSPPMMGSSPNAAIGSAGNINIFGQVTNFSVTVVPLPAPLLLFASAIGVLGFNRRR